MLTIARAVPSDLDLCTLARQGSRQAASLLVDRHAGMLVDLAKEHAAGCRRAAHVYFLAARGRAERAARGYEPGPQSPAGWLRRHAQWGIMDAQRQWAKRQRRGGEWVAEFGPWVAGLLGDVADGRMSRNAAAEALVSRLDLWRYPRAALVSTRLLPVLLGERPMEKRDAARLAGIQRDRMDWEEEALHNELRVLRWDGEVPAARPVKGYQDPGAAAALRDFIEGSPAGTRQAKALKWFLRGFDAETVREALGAFQVAAIERGDTAGLRAALGATDRAEPAIGYVGGDAELDRVAHPSSGARKGTADEQWDTTFGAAVRAHMEGRSHAA